MRLKIQAPGMTGALPFSDASLTAWGSISGCEGCCHMQTIAESPGHERHSRAMLREMGDPEECPLIPFPLLAFQGRSSLCGEFPLLKEGSGILCKITLIKSYRLFLCLVSVDNSRAALEHVGCRVINVQNTS